MAGLGVRSPVISSVIRAESEEVVPVNESTWVLPRGVTVGR